VIGDGILNGWKQKYVFDPFDPAGGKRGHDGYGSSTLQDYQPHRPTNSASCFGVTVSCRKGVNVRVTWATVAGPDVNAWSELLVGTN